MQWTYDDFKSRLCGLLISSEKGRRFEPSSNEWGFRVKPWKSINHHSSIIPWSALVFTLIISNQLRISLLALLRVLSSTSRVSKCLGWPWTSKTEKEVFVCANFFTEFSVASRTLSISRGSIQTQAQTFSQRSEVIASIQLPHSFRPPFSKTFPNYRYIP